jgi:membrane-associated phospholipid phosphatase
LSKSSLDRLLEVDRRLFQAIARVRSPVLDRVLPRLTRAANYSRIWIAIAGLLSISGPRGRRAAAHGLTSVAVTSALVNLVMKPLFRRTRPSLRDVPAMRRLRRAPFGTSFPSGHSASAAAFATGASLELPAAALALTVLAGGVALSRIHAGVHHPSDVAAGCATGVTVAWVTRPAFRSRSDGALLGGFGDEAPPRASAAARPPTRR